MAQPRPTRRTTNRRLVATYALERELLLAGYSYAQIAEKTDQPRSIVARHNRTVHKINLEQNRRRDRAPNAKLVATYSLERNLLLAGLSYAEIADKTGQPRAAVARHNQAVHKINLEQYRRTDGPASAKLVATYALERELLLAGHSYAQVAEETHQSQLAVERHDRKVHKIIRKHVRHVRRLASRELAATYALERELLLTGLSYAEIAEKTGQRRETVAAHNCLVHKINIRDAFASRCEREGVPCRVPADPNFCAWLSGFFDAEGSIVVSCRTGLVFGKPGTSLCLGVTLHISEADASTLDYVQQSVGCGTLYEHAARGGIRESITWACDAVGDLREVIVPLFDAFPLQSKKGREYALWRPLVIRRYIDTLGGRTTSKYITPEVKTFFENAIHAIREIRHPALH